MVVGAFECAGQAWRELGKLPITGGRCRAIMERKAEGSLAAL
jgi:hypothetical protein